MSNFRLQITPFTEDREVTREMFQILDAVLQAPCSISPAEAATKINELHVTYRAETPEANQRQNSDETDEDHATQTFLWEFWDLVFALARQIPVHDAAQDKIADFIRCLKNITSPRIEVGRELLWRDLPRIGWVSAEHMSSLDISEDPKEALRLCAFVARLTRDSTRDYCCWALWAFRDALEEDSYSSSDIHSVRNTLKLSVQLQQAALWIGVSGVAIFQNRKRYDSGSGGKLWIEVNGFEGFCAERWAFWKKRLGTMSHCEQLAQEIREIAIDIQNRMQEIENGS